MTIRKYNDLYLFDRGTVCVFFSPKCPDQLWVPPSLQLNSYQGYLNEMKAGTRQSWSLTSYCLHE